MTDADPTPTVRTLLAAGRDREAACHGAHAAAGVDALVEAGAAMDPLTQLGEIGPLLHAVVDGIGPADLDRATPCSGFTVRGVLEHMIGGATTFAAAYRGESPGAPDLTDPRGGLGLALGDLVAALSAPGALDQTVAGPFGEVPGETFARFIALDGLVHGWDLAMATRQAYEPTAELVAAVDGFARQALDPLRDGDTFATAHEPDPDATPMEQLAAYTGRRPLDHTT